jgi:hypothetical protein
VKVRDYKKDTAYENTPEQIKHREERNAARAALIKAGRVQKGDGLDVDHRHMLKSGGSNDPSNWDVKTIKKNRGWRKGKHGY